MRKERALRSKAGACANGGGDDGGMTSALIANLSVGPALEFERMDATRRLRLVLSEIMNVMGKIQADAEDPQQQQAAEFVTKSSELFDHVVYLAEVCDVLCIAMAELPNLLTPPEVAVADFPLVVLLFIAPLLPSGVRGPPAVQIRPEYHLPRRCQSAGLFLRR